MKVAVVFFAEKKRDILLNISKALAKGIEAQGHQVDIIDGCKENNIKLTVHKYIAIGAESASLFTGKISDKISFFLGSVGSIAGKRSFAYVIKSINSFKTLSNLMKVMEKEGMFLNNSTVFVTPEEALELGSQLQIKKS